MSGFPWTSLLTAVVPAAAVLAGAALTGRQNNQAGRTATLKADYAGFVQAVTALIEGLERIASYSSSPKEVNPRQLVSAVALARGVVDLAGSYGARRAAYDVWQAADEAADAAVSPRADAAQDFRYKRDDLQRALEDFLRAVRGEVGGKSRPGLKWIIQNFLRGGRRQRREHPGEPYDDRSPTMP
jgi:hypothetical protein